MDWNVKRKGRGTRECGDEKTCVKPERDFGDERKMVNVSRKLWRKGKVVDDK